MFVVAGEVTELKNEEMPWGPLTTAILREKKAAYSGTEYDVFTAVEIPKPLLGRVDEDTGDVRPGSYVIASGEVRSRRAQSGRWFTSLKAASLTKVDAAGETGAAEDMPF